MILKIESSALEVPRVGRKGKLSLFRDRLKEYITSKGIGSDRRIFPIFYTAARRVVNKAGKVVGVHLRPHDLRRHAATYASRSGVPIEIASKVILRHANLSTTQRYLGTVSDVEAMRWIENLYG